MCSSESEVMQQLAIGSEQPPCIASCVHHAMLISLLQLHRYKLKSARLHGCSAPHPLPALVMSPHALESSCICRQTTLKH